MNNFELAKTKGPELLSALVALLERETCLADYFNPCWSNRPTDVPGKHWGGGEACVVCKARALASSLGVKVDVWAVPRGSEPAEPEIIVGCEREPDYDDEEPEDTLDPDHAYHTYHLQTNSDSSISGTSETNDNLDHGYASQYASWTVRYRDRAHMDKEVGKSRIGCSGVVVDVYLDGTKI